MDGGGGSEFFACLSRPSGMSFDVIWTRGCSCS